MLVGFFDWRTASRSTVARPVRRPGPTIVTAGSTTPAGRSSWASYARYALTSFSVIVVRRGSRAGRAPASAIARTFWRNVSASRRDGWAEAAMHTMDASVSMTAVNARSSDMDLTRRAG